MKKKFFMALLCIICTTYCYSTGYKLATAIHAVLNEDHETIEQQLNFLAAHENPPHDMMVVKINNDKLNQPNPDQFNLLMIAAYKANKEILEKLIALKAPINKQNNNGRTALMLAGLSGNDEIIRYLLSLHGDQNIKDFSDYTLKWYIPYKTYNFINAIVEGNKIFIELYMPDTKQARLRGNRFVIIESINKEFGNHEDEKITPLMAIAAKKQFGVDTDPKYYAALADKVISMGVDINKQNKYGKTALIYATLAGNGFLINILRKLGATDVIHPPKSNTFDDRKNRITRISRTFSPPHTPHEPRPEKHAEQKNIPFDTRTAISAIFNDDLATFNHQLGQLSYRRSKVFTFIDDTIIQEFKPEYLRHKKLRDDDFNLIMLAAYKGNLEIFESIINTIPKEKKGSYINKQNNYGRTALMLAGLKGNHAVIRYLLLQNANVEKTDFIDQTYENYFSRKLFPKAIAFGDKEAITLYLPKKDETFKCNRLTVVSSINKQFNHQDDEKITPLMAIASKKTESQTPEDQEYYKELAQLLISRGVQVNKRNNYGRTALDYAIEADNQPMIQLLHDAENNPISHSDESPNEKGELLQPIRTISTYSPMPTEP